MRRALDSDPEIAAEMRSLVKAVPDDAIAEGLDAL